MIMMVFNIMISTAIIMYTELKLMRCVAQLYPIVYQPARSLYLERDHHARLYQVGMKKSKMLVIHHSFDIGSGLRLKNRWLLICIVL